jgi:hypothetical protein
VWPVCLRRLPGDYAALAPAGFCQPSRTALPASPLVLLFSWPMLTRRTNAPRLAAQVTTYYFTATVGEATAAVDSRQAKLSAPIGASP